MNPGATVIAVSDGTGIRLDRKTNAEDVSDVECADRDRQRDNCGRGGARDGKVMHVVVVSGNRSSIGNRARGLGAAAEKVQFEGGAAELLNTKTAQGEVILDSQQLSSMPVDGGFDGVALVAPGVVSMHMDGLSNTIGANFSVNGERGRANNFAIDGRSNNGNTIAGPTGAFLESGCNSEGRGYPQYLQRSIWEEHRARKESVSGQSQASL